VGIAVQTSIPALPLAGVGMAGRAAIETVTDQKVKVAMLPLRNASKWNLGTNRPESPVAKFMDKRGWVFITSVFA